ncbi:D-alanine--D-alanine ligase family protein [Paramicrobacterium chengjingii]|uniref:D-alanine--D-alanine ligase n=1 Tax=Paramicrobacterium chengjingii TaxID=2769067 RepID=A0ABX6YFL3_9MICO|nr:D-alanine--D-alanine ligase [Microbacterium chengjingii]QPZ37583.1 D-alanine--D-alanine ligase [Microbacterium chengjingii]
MRVAVLFGGASEERDVSIASASQIIPALRRRGHDVVAVDTASGAISPHDESARLTMSVGTTPPTGSDLSLARRSDNALRLPSEVADADVAFIALHGGSGEDGRLQALLELAGIRYTGSGPLGSGLALDKDVSKSLLRSASIRTPDWLMAPATAEEVASVLGYPVIVKPAVQGSTVGLRIVRQPDDLADAVLEASAFGSVMIEAFIRGRELTAGVLNDEPLAVGEIIIDPDEAFTYEDKYQLGAVRETFPADLPPAVTESVREITLATHRALRLESYSRTDFRLDENGVAWVIEANSLPGMTATSLLPQSAAAVGIDYDELCDRICSHAASSFRS